MRNFHLFDWHGARADYEKALALEPNNVPALIGEALLLATINQVRDGIATLRKVIAIDPMSVLALRQLAWLLMHDGQLPAARAALNRLLEIDPQGDPYGRVMTLELLSGRPREALAASRNPSLIAGFRLVGVTLIEHTLGHDAESRQGLAEMISTGAQAWAYQIAEVYAWRGERNQACEWLERAYRQGDGGLSYLTYDRFLVSLHSGQRYQALLRKLQLPAAQL